jgi:hypothetical protein
MAQSLGSIEQRTLQRANYASRFMSGNFCKLGPDQSKIPETKA